MAYRNLWFPQASRFRRAVVAAILELRASVKLVVMGAEPDTNIAIAGLKTTAVIKSVIGIDGDGVGAAAVVDFTADASVTSEGNLQTTSDSSAHQLIVEYVNR